MHKVFWQKLYAQDSILPESLSTHAAWAAFHQNFCAPPATPIQPDPPQPTRAAPPVYGLEAAITQAEVEKALQKLSNGLYFNVAQGPEFCLPLSHCLAAEGSDMNTIPSS